MRWRAWKRQCFTLKRSLRPGPLRPRRVWFGKVSVHDAGSFAAEVWQLFVRVVADAWPCWCSSVPGLLLEWDDWQRPRAGENSGARVAIERRGPSQFAYALQRRAAHRDCLPRKRPPNNRCSRLIERLEITRQALPLNFVRIWCPLRGHGAAAPCPAIWPRPRPVRDRSTSANFPPTVRRRGQSVTARAMGSDMDNGH